MGLFDFLKPKKKKDEAVPAAVPEDFVSLAGAELSEPVPPETRYTEEYQEYLASQGPAENREPPAGEDS